MDIKQRFQTIDCQLHNSYDPCKQVYVTSNAEKDDYLLPMICKQIEFYMGDANLSHDRYFQKLLSQNQNYIPLEAFLKCNKIKLLMLNYPYSQKQQIQILSLALKRSQILKLNKKEKAVKRIIGFDSESDYLDNRTIYVENIPDEVNIKIIHQIFSNIDTHILKVSLFRNYGFVTFLNQESVDQAIQKYNNFVPKEITLNQIKIRGSLRVLSKQSWLQYKKQYKEIKLKFKQLKKQDIEIETQSLKLVNVFQQELRVEELRIALHHAIDQRLISHVNINKENYYCIIECVNKEAAETLRGNVDRIQNYDYRFKKCYFI